VNDMQGLAVQLARTPFVRLTKAAVLRAVRKHPFRDDGLNQKGRVRAVYDLAWQIRRKRARRFFARYVRPVPPLPERLRSWRERKAREAARRAEAVLQPVVAEVDALFHPTRSGRKHHVVVEVVRQLEEVGAWGFSLWPTERRLDTVHRFRLTPDWIARVREPGLALLGDTLTLWAERMDDAVHRGERVEVYKAVWCARARGFGLHTERGYLARLGGHHRHAGNAEAAVRGVRSLARRAGGSHPFQTGAVYPPAGARVVFDGEGGFRVCMN
jgi:hypothetical protein